MPVEFCRTTLPNGLEITYLADYHGKVGYPSLQRSIDEACRSFFGRRK